MLDIIQIAGSLGVGAFLGLIMFVCYRQDRKCTEKRLTILLEKDQESREANTKALAEMVGLLKELSGRLHS